MKKNILYIVDFYRKKSRKLINLLIMEIKLKLDYYDLHIHTTYLQLYNRCNDIHILNLLFLYFIIIVFFLFYCNYFIILLYLHYSLHVSLYTIITNVKLSCLILCIVITIGWIKWDITCDF